MRKKPSEVFLMLPHLSLKDRLTVLFCLVDDPSPTLRASSPGPAAHALLAANCPTLLNCTYVNDVGFVRCGSNG